LEESFLERGGMKRPGNTTGDTRYSPKGPLRKPSHEPVDQETKTEKRQGGGPLALHQYYSRSLLGGVRYRPFPSWATGRSTKVHRRGEGDARECLPGRGKKGELRGRRRSGEERKRKGGLRNSEKPTILTVFKIYLQGVHAPQSRRPWGKRPKRKKKGR